jgi:signal transduction histidine kinase
MNENILKQQLRIERVVSSVAKEFVMFDDISKAINFALEKIGRVSNASRAYIFEFNENDETMSNTYEWCSEGIKPEIKILQNIPIDMFPWWIKKISSGKILNIKDINLLGPEAKSEKEILASQGIKSVLVLPLHFNKKLHGFVGFDNCKNSSIWKSQDEIVLNLASEIFSHGFERKKSDINLKESHEQLRNALDTLQRLQTQLVQQEQMAAIGQLAAGVAHEINNPLGFVMSNHEVLKGYISELLNFSCDNMSGPDSSRFNYIRDDTGELLEDIDIGLRRVQKIVEGLRSFSRVDNISEFYEFDLRQGIENTLIILNNRLKYKADVKLSVEKNLPFIIGNGNKINQVILNLVTNAIDAVEEKFGDKKGLIEISAYSIDDDVVLEIKDNGSGIPKEIQNKIYQPFFTTKDIGKGTGFGLSIAYDIIVTEHKGNIELKSSIGEGTKFTLTIPKFANIEDDFIY